MGIGPAVCREREGVIVKPSLRQSSSAASLVVALVGLLGTGCTMCPDIYDYSGPVPNGSPPQNDFRARSNGIAPIGTTPRPWPPLVQRDRPRQDGPVLVAGEEPAEPITR